MTSSKPSPTNKTDPAPHAETWRMLFENHPIPMWALITQYREEGWKGVWGNLVPPKKIEYTNMILLTGY